MKACPAQCSRQLGRKRHFDAESNGVLQALHLLLTGFDSGLGTVWEMGQKILSCTLGDPTDYIWLVSNLKPQILYKWGIFVWLYFYWGILYISAFPEWKVKNTEKKHFRSSRPLLFNGWFLPFRLISLGFGVRSMVRFSTEFQKVTVSSATFCCISPSHIYASKLKRESSWTLIDLLVKSLEWQAV